MGGIDCNKLRTRSVMHAAVALSTSQKGFTASDLAVKVRALGGLPDKPYQPLQAANDLKKLRGKEFATTPKGIRATAALAVLRDKIIKPLLAASCAPTLSPEANGIPLDQHYENVRCGMRGLFGTLGIAA